MNSRMLANGSFFPVRSARRNATVTISQPLDSSASRISSPDANFPVPSMSRERMGRLAMVRGWDPALDSVIFFLSLHYRPAIAVRVAAAVHDGPYQHCAFAN